MNYFRDALDFELESRGNDLSEEGDEDLEQLIRSICYQSPGVPRKPNELLPTDLIKAIKDSKNVMYFLLYYCNRELSRVNHPLNHLLKWYVSEKLLRTSKPSVIDMYVSSRWLILDIFRFTNVTHKRHRDAQAALLDHAFREKYVGDAVSDFRSALSDESDGSPYKYQEKTYGRIIALASSSGTGKSKFVYELSTKVLIVPFPIEYLFIICL